MGQLAQNITYLVCERQAHGSNSWLNVREEKERESASLHQKLQEQHDSDQRVTNLDLEKVISGPHFAVTFCGKDLIGATPHHFLDFVYSTLKNTSKNAFGFSVPSTTSADNFTKLSIDSLCKFTIHFKKDKQWENPAMVTFLVGYEEHHLPFIASCRVVMSRILPGLESTNPTKSFQVVRRGYPIAASSHTKQWRRGCDVCPARHIASEPMFFFASA